LAKFFLSLRELTLFHPKAVLNGFQSRRTRAAGTRAGAVLMLGLWLAAMMFASSTRLHGLVCADSQNASHDCLLTSFTKSKLLPLADPTYAPPAAMVASDAAQPVSPEPARSADIRSAPSRAPPSPFVLR
jgi:hypothetical protein